MYLSILSSYYWSVSLSPGQGPCFGSFCSPRTQLRVCTQLVHSKCLMVVVLVTNLVNRRTEGPFLPCPLGWTTGHLLPLLSRRYHLMYKPPPTTEIQDRLLQNPKDAEEHVKFKMDLFYRNAAELEEFYGQALTINGDQDPYTVFEYIESGIINPLPQKVP